MGQARLLISYFLISFLIASCTNNSRSKEEDIENQKKVFNCVVDYLDKEILSGVEYSINPTLYELVDTSLFREQLLNGLDSIFTSKDLDRMINQYEKKKIDWVKKYLDPKYYGNIEANYDERYMIIFGPPLINNENTAVVVVSLNRYVSENEYAGDIVMFFCSKSNDEWNVELYNVMR
jgi:hypothetical protein